MADGVSKSLLSSNGVPIGYNASNFSVTVQNAATVPPGNQTWLIEVDTYMIQAGGLNGKYLLNATTASIEVGSTPVPEFQADHSLVLLLALTATLGLYRRQLHNRRG